MKKLVFLLLFALGWQIVVLAGAKAVFPYNYPSKRTLMSLAMENSLKGKAYGDYLLYAVNLGLADTTLTISRNNIQILFNNLFSEDFNLPESSYKNSGYDSVIGKMVPSIGHNWNGFVWVFRIGTYTIPLIKTNCGNVLIVKTIRTKVSIPSTVSTTVAPLVSERVYTPQVQEQRPVVRYYEPERRVEKFVVNTKSSGKEIRIWKVVIPVGAMLAGAIYYFSRREIMNSSYPSDRRGSRDNGGGGQDPPPTNDDGGPIDPPPSGN